jgi:hypothetical protein
MGKPPRKMFRRNWSDFYSEEDKDNHAIPDLGIGMREERDSDGQLYIFFHPRRHVPSPYVVVGKYAQPRKDGTEYYVADWTMPGVNPVMTTYHEHLLQVVARILELQQLSEGTNS